MHCFREGFPHAGYFKSVLAKKKPHITGDNLLLIGLYFIVFTAGSNQTSRLDIKNGKYI
jgi:hypothetical protein